MTSKDLSQIQEQLEISLPKSYIKLMLSRDTEREDIFYDKTKIIQANLDVRTKCWCGEPLSRFFYVFGSDKQERLLILDLDFPGGGVLRQIKNSTDPDKRSDFLSLSFEQWLERSKTLPTKFFEYLMKLVKMPNKMLR